MPRSSPPMKKPVTCSRPSRSSRLVWKKPLRIAYTALNSSPALNSDSPRLTRRRAYTMFSTRCRSSMHTPPGRHISRRLQLEQVTSNLRGASVLVMEILLSGATCMMGLRSMRLSRRAFREHVAYALEFPALVEEIGCPQRRGELAVRKRREVGE